MHYLIYQITNRLNKKFYVGKHKTENKNDEYFGSGLLLKHAVKKYGKENFSKEILFECLSLEEMNQKETDIVDEEFVARDDTYNIKLGGQGGWSEEEHKLGSETVKDLRKDENFCLLVKQRMKKAWEKRIARGYIQYFTGKKHSEISKNLIGEKNSVHQKGKGNSQFGTHWITNGSENKKQKKNLSLPNGWKKGRV